MAARVIPAHNPFMSWKPLANGSQKNSRRFLLISEITFAPVKGVFLVLLLRDYLISARTSQPRGSAHHLARVSLDSPFGGKKKKKNKCKTKLSFDFKTFRSLIFIIQAVFF